MPQVTKVGHQFQPKLRASLRMTPQVKGFYHLAFNSILWCVGSDLVGLDPIPPGKESNSSSLNGKSHLRLQVLHQVLFLEPRRLEFALGVQFFRLVDIMG